MSPSTLFVILTNSMASLIPYILAENPKINKRVTDILEGTMRAFRIRDDKYQDSKKG